jgi:hypothetical protein
MKENGFGKIIIVEFDPAIRPRAQERFKTSLRMAAKTCRGD